METTHVAHSPSELYRLAASNSIALDQGMKDQMPPDLLFALCLTGKLGLNSQDRGRLRPLHLAHLALVEKIELDADDKDRVEPDMLFELYYQGVVDLTDHDVQRLSPRQQAVLGHVEGPLAAAGHP